MSTAPITILIDKYLDGTISADEQQQLVQLLREPAHQQYLQRLLDSELAAGVFSIEPGEKSLENINRYFDEQFAKPVRRVHVMRRWVWAAASVIVLLSAGIFLWTNNKKNEQPAIVAKPSSSIGPGRDGAILTLADGSQVLLDTIQNGTVALQGGAVAKVQQGTLVYEPNGNDVVYNTMSTPRGRQFRLQLPDGTQVWLNAASSVRYPTVFAGKERTVEVSGEAYFEVAKNATMPFRVQVNNKAEVEVLGTQFNVNAYNNEASINTTLLQGSVKVVSKENGQWSMLKPGEQVSISRTSQLSQPMPAETDKVIAWKNGQFNFNDMPLEEVMRQLERWYDIEVVYEQGIPDLELKGKMLNDISLNDLIDILKKLGLHSRLEGRKLIVLPG